MVDFSSGIDTGAPVAGAAVRATETGTMIVRSTITNEAGNFTFPLMDPGAYALEVTREGFKKSNRSGITLDANSTVRADFTLEIGSVTETIDVTASVAILQTDRADLGTKIERQ